MEKLLVSGPKFLVLFVTKTLICHHKDLVTLQYYPLPPSLSNQVTKLYRLFCHKAHFENVNLFQCDWYIREQFQHNENFAFVCIQIHLWESLSKHRKLYSAELSHVGIHKYQSQPQIYKPVSLTYSLHSLF